MLKSTKLRKQRKARNRAKVVMDTKQLHNMRVELYRKLEEELAESEVVAFEVPPSKVMVLLEVLDDDFKMMYSVRQLSKTLYEFKLKEIM